MKWRKWDKYTIRSNVVMPFVCNMISNLARYILFLVSKISQISLSFLFLLFIFLSGYMYFCLKFIFWLVKRIGGSKSMANIECTEAQLRRLTESVVWQARIKFNIFVTTTAPASLATTGTSGFQCRCKRLCSHNAPCYLEMF